MLTLMLLIPIAALLILDYFIADEFRCIAQMKGYCGRKYFWWSFFTGFVGYLMVAALPNRFCCFRGDAEVQKAEPAGNGRYNTDCHC